MTTLVLSILKESSLFLHTIRTITKAWIRLNLGIQFNLLLSPYPCFISLLYLDLYVLGDDALIS